MRRNAGEQEAGPAVRKRKDVIATVSNVTSRISSEEWTEADTSVDAYRHGDSNPGFRRERAAS